MSSSRALIGGVAAPLLAALVLSSCGIPDESAPEAATPAPTDFEPGSAIEAEEFAPSTDAETTVQNFLKAATGDSTGLDARLNEFTETDQEYSDRNEGIDLLDDVTYSQVDEGESEDFNTVTIEVTGSVTGTYQPDGQVLVHSTPPEYDEQFVLHRERPGEEWLMNEVPTQVTLLADQFEASYDQAPLYFRASGYDLLVPDLRWIYGRLDQETEHETRLDWVFNGPSEWAKASAASAIPAGTSGQITEEDDLIVIDLTLGDSSDAGNRAGGAIAAELAWSLGLTEEFELRVNGEPVVTGSLHDWRDWNAIPAAQTGEEIGYFIADDTVWQFANEEVTAASAQHPWVGFQVPGLRQVAVSRNAQIAAVVAEETGTRLRVGPDEDRMETVEDLSGSLRDPQWLVDGTVLILDGGVLTAVDPDDGSTQALTGESVTALEVAPDGHRLAYVEDGRAWALPLKHDADGNLRIGERRRIGPEITGVADVAWSSENFLWVAGERRGEDQLFRVAIDNSQFETQAGTSVYPRIDEIAASPADPQAPVRNRGEPVVVVIDSELVRVHTTSLQPIDDDGDGQPVRGSSPFTVLDR
ncbi:hypothetical protein GCM10027447_03150 [Glycomyces halotolerans]